MTIYLKLIGSDKYLVNNLMNFGGRYIYRDDEQPPSYVTLCDQFITKLLKDITITIVLLIVSYCLMAIWPLYCIIVRNERVTILNTELPFVDIDSDMGFTINLCWQAFAGYFSFISNVCIEYGNGIAHNNIHSTPKVLHFQLEEFKKEIIMNGVSLNAKLRLRNVFMLLRDFEG